MPHHCLFVFGVQTVGDRAVARSTEQITTTEKKRTLRPLRVDKRHTHTHKHEAQIETAAQTRTAHKDRRLNQSSPSIPSIVHMAVMRDACRYACL